MGRLSSFLVVTHATDSASALPDPFGVAALGFLVVLVAVAWWVRDVLKRLSVSTLPTIDVLDLRPAEIRGEERAALLRGGQGQVGQGNATDEQSKQVDATLSGDHV